MLLAYGYIEEGKNEQNAKKKSVFISDIEVIYILGVGAKKADESVKYLVKERKKFETSLSQKKRKKSQVNEWKRATNLIFN